MTPPNTPPVSPALLRVAEACVRASNRMQCCCETCDKQADALRAHARAIRERKIQETT